MKIVVYYNKNLKMSEGKLAAQVGHVCLNLGLIQGFVEGANDDYSNDGDFNTIVVLGLRQNKFKEKLEEIKDYCEDNYNLYHVQEDLGLTEVDEGTITAFGYIE